MHRDVLLLEVDEQPRREAVAHDLPVVPDTRGVVAELDLGAGVASHLADADEAAAKATAAEMRKHVTDATTAVVLELGGDSSKASSEQYLCSDKTPLTIYGLKTKPIRLPKACPRRGWSSTKLVGKRKTHAQRRPLRGGSGGGQCELAAVAGGAAQQGGRVRRARRAPAEAPRAAAQRRAPPFGSCFWAH